VANASIRTVRVSPPHGKLRLGEGQPLLCFCDGWGFLLFNRACRLKGNRARRLRRSGDVRSLKTWWRQWAITTATTTTTTTTDLIGELENGRWGDVRVSLRESISGIPGTTVGGW
jgi:hypothetical protein